MTNQQRDRGATAVEYALGVAVFVTLIIGALEFVQERSADRFEAQQEAIAAGSESDIVTTTSVPGTSTTLGATTTTTASTTTTVGVTTTTVAPTTTTAAPTTTTTAPPTITGGCPSNRSCSFTLNNAPAGTTHTWTISTGGSGSGGTTYTSGTISSGSKTITVVWTTPSGQTFTKVITCGSGNSKCS